MPDAWYYATPEEQVGPITLQELKRTLPTLPNVRDVYIWHDSLPEWIRAGDLAEIVARKSAPVQEVEPDDNSDNNPDTQNPDTQDAAIDTHRGVTPLDELDLDELHPDPAYAITMPASSPEQASNAAVSAKSRSVIGLLVGAVLLLLGFGLVCVGLIGALPRASRAFALTGSFLLVAGLLVIWFGRSKTPPE